MEKSAESRRRLINSLLDSLGTVIINSLKERDLVEIMLNPDGRLFIEWIGKGMEEGGAMATRYVQIVTGKVAHEVGRERSPQITIISGELPIGRHRFEGRLPPIVSSPIFTIRKKASLLIRTDQYVTDQC